MAGKLGEGRLNSLPAVTREELKSKHLAELHELAAEAGIPRYRMLQRGELVKRLSEQQQPRKEQAPAPQQPRQEQAAAPQRPKRKRRRRRWGRRRKDIRLHDLLLPGAHGRQAIVYAESRAGCTALLREVAAELAGASKGADPIALLVDPSPEELAEWRREAPRAELVAAGQARHAEDALAQATARANGGEDVVVLIDSLSRFAADFAGAEEAKDLFDAGLGAAGASGGSLTVVAAVEKSD